MSFNPRDINYLFDEPVIYKELILYPVLMRYYYEFNYYSQCLLLEKNSIPDPNIISMSYLDYLYFISNEENRMLYIFDGLLRLCLNKKEEEFKIEYGKDEDGKSIFVIDGERYYYSDFDELRKIIAEQNYLDLPNENIQKEVRDKMREAREYKRKMRGEKMASLEDQIITLAIYTGWDIQKIKELTIRKFIKSLERADHLIHSMLYSEASLSGMVDFKDKSIIKHWLSDSTKDEFSDITVDLDQIKEKTSVGSG